MMKYTRLGKKDFIWIAAAVVAAAVAALLIFLPRGGKGPDAIPAPNAAGRPEETPSFPERDPGGAPAESALGVRVPATREETAKLEAAMREIGDVCRAEYLRAEKLPSDNPGQETIGQEAVDAMEAALSGAGYCVENSDAVYPDYLENAETLNRFWEDVLKEQDAAAAVWGVTPGGSVSCRVFQYADGKGYCMHASGQWDDAGALELAYLEKKEILYWDMTPSGFLYQDIRLDRHWNAANLLRARPVDHDLYAWTERYIAPIGYHDVNLFLLDWDSGDFGDVCFNDLLSRMYRMEYGDYLYARDYPYADEPFPHSVIPAALFESVIYKHFSISLDEFRERAFYDAENDAYPWQTLNGGNIAYYPELIPEVTQVTEHADGTVTLLVNVLCPDQHTDHLFEHEVTMKTEADGSFQYLSNRLVYRGKTELPSPQARIKALRFAAED